MEKILNKRISEILTSNSIYGINFKDISEQKRALALSGHLFDLETMEEKSDAYFNFQKTHLFELFCARRK